MQDTFNSGYTKALIDMKDFFESFDSILRREKMYNKKNFPILLNTLINDREVLRTYGATGITLKYDIDKKEFSILPYGYKKSLKND